ncbi:MAG: outer membrane protein assembly factor BamA [Deltaproteobacteria bacterium]|nr:outer membrane protein assembly factor BamA [Deltaproteobacteria bacterium]
MQTYTIPNKIICSVYALILFFACFSSVYANSDQDGLENDSANQLIHKIYIEILDAHGPEEQWIDLIRNTIYIQEGQLFSPSLLQDSIKALKLSNKFQSIDVESREELGAISIVLRLRPFRYIKDIKINGEFPLFERDVIDRMTMYVGSVFSRDELTDQDNFLTKFFQNEGFTAPLIKTAWQEDPHDGNIIVHIEILKGPFIRLNNLDVKGNQSFGNARIKAKLKVWRASLMPGYSGRFRKEDIIKDVKNLTKFYREAGYPECIVDFTLTKDPESNSAFISLTIDEGPLYEIDFINNKKFCDYTLKKDLLLFQQGNKNDIGLKKSIKKIQERYRKAGFAETSIKIDESKSTNKSRIARKLRLIIDEGSCSKVSSIEISGNTMFTSKKIQKQMLTRRSGFIRKGIFIPETLDDDQLAIKALYAGYGFLDTSVNKNIEWSPDNDSVAVKIAINEGIQTIVTSIKIVGATGISDQEAYDVIALKEGEPFRKYMLRNDESALSALLSEKGYPHVKVKSEVMLSTDRTKASVIYTADTGPYVSTGKVYYSGNFRTKNKILANEIDTAPGEPFSLAALLTAQRNLQDLGIFKSVKIKPVGLENKQKTVNLFAEIEEEKPYFIQAGGGYETNRGFFIQTRAGDHNLFGTNKDTWAGYELSQIGYRAEFGINEPRLFGYHLSANFGVFSEKREEFNQIFGTRIIGSSLSFSKKISKSMYAGISFRFEQRDQFRSSAFDPNSDIINVDVYEPRSILVSTPSVSYDTRDSFIRPRTGMVSSFSVDISNGIKNSLDNFYKYRFDLRYYITPHPRITFACLGRYGHIDSYSSSGIIPDDQLFFLGGTSDVRGFDENLLYFDSNGDPIGGRSALMGSLETRIDVGHNFELAAFYDIGSVRNLFIETDLEKFRSSIGGGLRYITPIGPISLLYGFNLDPKADESKGRLHFSIGYTF